MGVTEITVGSAVELRERLAVLEQEHAAVGLHRLDRHAAYMADLSSELQMTRRAYVGAAVTEIASLRAALGSPLVG